MEIMGHLLGGLCKVEDGSLNSRLILSILTLDLVSISFGNRVIRDSIIVNLEINRRRFASII